MTGRLSDIHARIDGIRQLSAVVNAMRGIAAARAQQARGQLSAVDSYAATIVQAIAQTLPLVPPTGSEGGASAAHPALILFCAEQGFAGAFSERVLDSVGADLAECDLFVVGTRGASIVAERGLASAWRIAMPSHSLGISKLADRISDALYTRIAAGHIDRLDAVFSRWQPGHGVHVERRRLFPLDLASFARPPEVNLNPPILNLAPENLLFDLAAGYMHAQLCTTALHAFAAENEARLESMTAARSQIERQLSELEGLERVLRQGAITAEIIELAAGETASRARR